MSGVLRFVLAATAGAQQVTRGQVLKAMYKADSYHAAGKDSLAIALLDSMATLIPRLSVIYEREGRIYESMYEKQQSKSALNAAVLMYRRYLSLEMNENKTREVSQRLRELEDKLQVAHFEDEEEALAQEEEKIDLTANYKKLKDIEASITDSKNNLNAFLKELGLDEI